MKKTLILIAGVLLVFVFVVTIKGDTIELLTGAKIEGKIVKVTKIAVIIETGEGDMAIQMGVPIKTIHAITYKGKRRVLKEKPVSEKKPVVKQETHKKKANHLDITFTNSTAKGRFSPHHCIAVWIEDNSGNFIVSLDVWGKRYYRYLLRWRDSYHKVHKTGFDMDAVTGATQKAYGRLSTSWDMLDRKGRPVPDGTYRMCIELTDENSKNYKENNYAFFTFQKDGNPAKQTGLNKGGFSGVTLDYSFKEIKKEANNLDISFSTSSAKGRFSPHHCVAVWIEYKSGKYVTSTDVWGKHYYRYLLRWRNSFRRVYKTGFDMDAVSGATQKRYGKLTSTWDMLDRKGRPVPDGMYRICFELTDANSKTPKQNNFAIFAFKKDGKPSKQRGMKKGGFSNVTLDYSKKKK